MGIETLAWEPLFVMRLNVAYDQAQPIGGESRLGIFPVHGGTFEGARLKGRVMPDGADWVTWRADGTMIIDVRTSLETENASGRHARKIVTEIAPAKEFYAAEDYHQEYYRLNKRAPYCRMVIQPKLKKLGLED